jgi:hypothetical protein
MCHSNLLLGIFPTYTYYENGTEDSETSANKIQKLGNYQKERTQHSLSHLSFMGFVFLKTF